MKTSKDYMSAANATVPRITAQEAIEAYNAGGGVFVDVRDSASIAQSGTIQGAHHIPRGMIEFIADPEMTALHNPVLAKDAAIFLVCGAGGQAALAGKTLQEMGFESVTNIGGIGDWKAAGGPMDA